MKKIFIFFILLIAIECNADTWIRKADAPTNFLRRAASFSIGNKGYALGGWDNNLPTFSAEFWEYDPSLDVWTQKANFAGGKRANLTALTINGKGYVGFGVDTAYQFKNDLWSYDQGTNIWTQKANFSGPPRQLPLVFSIGSKGYFSCGVPTTGAGYFYKDLWEYNSILNTWTAKSNLPTPGRAYGVGFSINGMGYITGGYNDSTNQYHHNLLQYDPLTDNWTVKSNIPNIQCFDAGAFTIGNYGYVYGGEAPSPLYYYNKLWQYNPTTDNWTLKSPCPVTSGRDEMVIFSIGNKGYMGWGGRDGNPPFSDFWEYTPDSSEMSLEIPYLNFQLESKISPNPFNDFTTLTFSKTILNGRIEIYDLQGKKTKSYLNVRGEQFVLEASSLKRGLYILRLIENERIILNRKIEIK